MVHSSQFGFGYNVDSIHNIWFEIISWLLVILPQAWAQPSNSSVHHLVAHWRRGDLLPRSGAAAARQSAGPLHHRLRCGCRGSLRPLPRPGPADRVRKTPPCPALAVAAGGRCGIWWWMSAAPAFRCSWRPGDARSSRAALQAARRGLGVQSRASARGLDRPRGRRQSRRFAGGWPGDRPVSHRELERQNLAHSGTRFKGAFVDDKT